MTTDQQIDAIYHGLLLDGMPKRKAWRTAVDMVTKPKKKRAGKVSTARKAQDAASSAAPSTIPELGVIVPESGADEDVED